MKKCLLKKSLAAITTFFFLFYSVLPLNYLSLVRAQEVTTPIETPAPTQEVTPQEPAPVEQSQPTTSTESSESTVTPSPEPTTETIPASSPEPTNKPTPTTENIQPTIAPTETPSTTPEVTPTEAPVPQPSAELVSPTPQPTPIPLWTDLQNSTYETSSNLVLNEIYSAPQNDKVKVQFTKLPESSGKLTIKELKLTSEQIADTGALSETAYEITSTMPDGTFEYDLTLPLPPGTQNIDVEVKTAETMGELDNAQKVEEPKVETQETITIKGLNHFTVFVITTPSPDTAQRVLINEILPNPSTGSEWIELYNNGTTTVDLSAGTGWTIRNSAGTSQSLSGMGTIASGAVEAFDLPAGFLSNTAPETVTILNANGTTIDTVTISLFSPGTAIDHYPLAGESVGRRTDGVSDWIIFVTPSKGSSNVINISSGSLAQTGPIDGTSGFPTWYKDGNGIALDLMEAADPNGISAPVESGNAFSEQIGFGAEGFWWSADTSINTSAGSADLVQAIEAAFVGESAIDGEQSSFARVRIRIDVAEPGTYTVTYPYGQKTYVVTTPGTRAINDTIDIGCFAQPGVLDCSQSGTPNFSTLLNGGIGPFLTWSTFNSNPSLSDPALSVGGRRYVGLGTVEHAVTGSPTGNNFFRIQGPNIGGAGVNVIQTNLFTVTGRLADNSNPVITLFGSNPVNVLQNGDYTDAGATAIDSLGGNLTPNIVVSGLPVDTSTLGAKTVTYTVTDNVGNSASTTRTVNVVEAPATDLTDPVITITGTNPISVVQGITYTDAGATALDNVDGDISANIITTGLPIDTSTLGEKTVTYTVTDAAGNEAVATRTVNVIADTVDPVITVLGSDPVHVFIGATYTDAGATALDNVNGDLTGSIITTGLPIDTSSAASHTVTYTVTDSSGNEGSATRSVHVAATHAAGLLDLGAVNPTTGFPTWYQDSNGISLDLMEAADPNGISAPVEEGNAFSEQIGFGAEGFWWSADATVNTSGPNGAIIVQAIEAAFGGESAVDGEQSAFARVRIRIDVGEPGTYTVTFPYGSRTYTVSSVGAGYEINDTSDIGCFAQPGVFSCDRVAAPNFGTVLTGEIGPFLTWDTFNTNPALSDPLLTNAVTNRRYVGLSAVEHTVTGSPTGNNFFRIEGPNIGGAGVNSVETNLFAVTGRVVEPVNNSAPIITILGDNPATVIQNAAYTDAGATATDDPDGDLTLDIITTGLPIDTATLGANTITYSVTDSDSNTTEVTRTINVVAPTADTTAPVITRLGTSPVTVTVGNTYTDAGATAFDNVDGTITASIVTVNPVNTAVAGTYTVTYNVSDASGNAASEVTRTVNVVEAAPTTGTITIVKDAIPNNAQDFEFRLRSGVFDQSFFLDDDADATLPNTRAFADLTPGSFDLQETAVGGWAVTSISCQDADSGTTVDLNARTATVDLDAGENVTCTFSNSLRRSISGIKFNDLDGDGIKDAGEPGLENWTIFLDTNDNGVLDGGETSTLTDSTGAYQFIDVATGTQNVREIVQDNWTQTAPIEGKHVLNVTSGSGFVNQDFGNFEDVIISGVAFHDLDTDGVRDEGESALSGWNITLTEPAVESGLTMGTVSAVDGSYSFTVTRVGDFLITITVPEGWASTLPSGSTSSNVSVETSGQNITVLAFGATQVAEMLGGTFALGSGDPESATYVTAMEQITINVPTNDGITSVIIPDGTIITAADGSNFNASLLQAQSVLSSFVQGIAEGSVVDGVIQWGIPNLGLTFSEPITVNMNVGTALNGQTLSAMRSVSGTGGWTTDGLVAPGTCLVTAGICSFQTTRASYFVTSHTPAIAETSTSSTTSSSSSSSSSGSSSDGSASAPVCNATKPGSAPILSIASSGPNEVTLSWTKATDPVSYYLLAFGLSSGDMQYGNSNIGGSDATSYTVKGLSAGTSYFFRVRAGNGCMPGDFSNEVQVSPTGAVLEQNVPEGFSDEVLGTATEEKKTPDKEKTLGVVSGPLNNIKKVTQVTIDKAKTWPIQAAIVLILLAITYQRYRYLKRRS